MSTTVATDLLPVYLNDHLAGATFGIQLVRRIRQGAAGTAMESDLAELTQEIEEDRETLKSLMADLGAPEDRIKRTIAWGAEKASRMKPNGRLLGSSPLSLLIDLEMLALGITGKQAMWRALEVVLGPAYSGHTFAELIERAEAQRRLVEMHRIGAARAALTETDQGREAA